MVPREVTIQLVEEELPGLHAWAVRTGVDVQWHRDALGVRVVLGVQAADTAQNVCRHES